MKKLCFLAAMLAGISINAQTVGVGTNTPNTTAVLDIFSTNKGVLIPRILDTATVTNPLEGLIIYNRNTRSPYYYNGNQWLSLGGRLPITQTTVTDRITYSITGADFAITERNIFASTHSISIPTSYSTGGSVSAGNPAFSAISFTKELDVNSKAINQAAVQGRVYASIEFKFYASGAAIPYASYRFKNFIFSSYGISAAAGGGTLLETIALEFENYGFKDWTNNLSFGFSLSQRALTAY